MNEVYIVIDVGGTYARVASTRSLEEPNFENNNVIELTHIFEDDFNHILKTIEEIPKSKILAIGIGTPGVINEGKDTILSATNLPEWTNINLKNILSDYFNCEVFLDNDGITSSFGEVTYGGKDKEDFIFMIWGTGVGSILVEVSPVLNARQIQAEEYSIFGTIRRNSYGSFLLKKYGKQLGELEQSDWVEIISDFEKLIIYLSENFVRKNIILSGGVALKQHKNIKILSDKLKKEKGINLELTQLGDNHTFGLYGSCALIKYYKNK